MTPLGVSISDTSIHYVGLKSNDSKNTLSIFGKRDLADGIIINGEIKKPVNLIAILKEIQTETKAQFVKVSLPEEETYVFQMQIPGNIKTQEEVRQSIEFRLEENVPLPVKDLVFDYEIIKFSQDETILEVSVSAVASHIIESYSEAFKTAGFLPVGFGVESKLVARAVVPNDDKDTYILVNIKEHATTISIVDDGIVQFTSTAAIGGKAIDESVSRHINATIKEAKKIKEDHLYQEGFDSMKVFPSLINFVSAIKDEVERFYSFWSKNKSIPLSESKIKRIILCGHNSSIAGFERYFYLSLKKDVKLANVWINAFSLDEYTPKVDFTESLDYAAAVGAVLIK
ncbi:MAG: pilus assembly protein PilM [Minisyncoccia bacterium]